MHGKCNYLGISLPFSNIQVIAQSYVPYEHTIILLSLNRNRTIILNKTIHTSEQGDKIVYYVDHMELLRHIIWVFLLYVTQYSKIALSGGK